jgi:hypothetical protein
MPNRPRDDQTLRPAQRRAARALSLGYVSHLVSPLYSVKSFDQNHSCIQIPAACKRRNMSTHSLYS